MGAQLHVIQGSKKRDVHNCFQCRHSYRRQYSSYLQCAVFGRDADFVRQELGSVECEGFQARPPVVRREPGWLKARLLRLWRWIW